MSRRRLTTRERSYADALFEAVLGPTEAEGLPAFASIDRARFWETLDTAPAPSFALGLRAMVWSLTMLPIADPDFRKPFHALSRDQRMRFVEKSARDERYLVRQSWTTVKMLASFAYFEDETVRARFAKAAFP